VGHGLHVLPEAERPALELFACPTRHLPRVPALRPPLSLRLEGPIAGMYETNNVIDTTKPAVPVRGGRAFWVRGRGEGAAPLTHFGTFATNTA
jgi:hypothetical protein